MVGDMVAQASPPSAKGSCSGWPRPPPRPSTWPRPAQSRSSAATTAAAPALEAALEDWTDSPLPMCHDEASAGNGVGPCARSRQPGRDDAEVGLLRPGGGSNGCSRPCRRSPLTPRRSATPWPSWARPARPMDPGDDLSDPDHPDHRPDQSLSNPDNPTMTAGFAFLGQFLDHDMTFDPTSSWPRRQDPEAIRNYASPLTSTACTAAARWPRPTCTTRPSTPAKTTLLAEEIPGSGAVSIDSSARMDLPRNDQLVALVGDPQRREPGHVPAPAGVRALPQPGPGRRQGRPRPRLHRAVRRGPAAWSAGTTSG